MSEGFLTLKVSIRSAIIDGKLLNLLKEVPAALGRITVVYFYFSAHHKKFLVSQIDF